MSDTQLALAQQARMDVLYDEELDRHLDVLLSEADAVGPAARNKLKGILRHYAKDPHPFRACVKDNMKRFGPGRTERVCATLKDIIRGTTRWRGHPSADHGASGIAGALAEPLDEDVEALLLSIPDEKLEAFFLGVMR